MLEKPRQRLACLLAVACLGGLTAACGFPPVNTEAVAVYAKFAAMKGKSRHDQLVDAAKAEGQLVIYVTNTAIEKKIVPAFEKEYGIDVAVYRATTEQVRGRVLQEAGAHRVLNDVVETKDSEMAILGQQGLIAPYTSDIAGTIPAEAKTDDMVGAYYIATLPIHNVRLVQPGQLPPISRVTPIRSGRARSRSTKATSTGTRTCTTTTRSRKACPTTTSPP